MPRTVIDLGLVGFQFLGEWDAETVYGRNQLVEYQKETWIADHEGVVGVEPGTTDDWHLFVGSGSAEEATAAAKAAALSQQKAEEAASKAEAEASEAEANKTAAETAATQAATSASEAEANKTDTETAATQASGYSADALASKTAAETAAATATTKADEADASAKSAAKFAEDTHAVYTENETWANTSKSYAIGEGLGEARPNEAVDNSKYYYEQSKRISEGLQGATMPMGTVTFEQLKEREEGALPGYLYNISNDFKTDDSFEEGAGFDYAAGTNVYMTANRKWDAMAGTSVLGVKGETEETYRRGQVSISKTDIGLGNVPNVTTDDQTPTIIPAEERTPLSAGDKLSIIFGKIAKWFSDLKPIAFSSAYLDLTGAPTTLPNPNALNFSGAVSGSYDGTNQKTVTIPSQPRSWQLSLSSSSWSGSSTSGYTQTVSATGMTSAVKLSPAVGYVTGSSVALATKKSYAEALGCISEVTSGSGSVTFTCYEKAPAVALTVLVQEVL